MKAYQADNSFDVLSAVYDAKALYDNLSAAEKEDFQDCALRAYNIGDINTLRDVFGPLIGL